MDTKLYRRVNSIQYPKLKELDDFYDHAYTVIGPDTSDEFTTWMVEAFYLKNALNHLYPQKYHYEYCIYDDRGIDVTLLIHWDKDSRFDDWPNIGIQRTKKATLKAIDYLRSVLGGNYYYRKVRIFNNPHDNPLQYKR